MELALQLLILSQGSISRHHWVHLKEKNLVSVKAIRGPLVRAELQPWTAAKSPTLCSADLRKHKE